MAETNAVTSETQSQIETSPEPVSEKKLNLDLLSDIGLAYGQLKEKYGDVKGFLSYQVEVSVISLHKDISVTFGALIMFIRLRVLRKIFYYQMQKKDVKAF